MAAPSTRIASFLRRATAAPILHFAAAGALLFVASAYWRGVAAAPPRAPIVVTAEDLERGRRDWALREGVEPASLPSDREILAQTIDDAVLLREAQARAFDRRDPVARARLIALGHYLGLAAGDGDAAVEREARALGLATSDEVLRRHLIEMMRLAAAKPGLSDLPGESELEAYYGAHQDRFMQPARVALTHIYLSRDRHGDSLDADASRMLASLQRDATSPRAAGALGDPFVRGARVPLSSPAELDRTFGPGFAAAIENLPAHTWSGPIRSPYGLHLIWIESRRAPAAPPFGAVRNQLLHQYLNERSTSRADDRMREWRARYDIRIEQ